MATLAACQGKTTAQTTAAKPAIAKQKSGVPAVIDYYRAKEYVAAYAAIPDRAVAKRMYNSKIYGSKPPVEREKGVTEEFLCFVVDRCDVVSG